MHRVFNLIFAFFLFCFPIFGFTQEPSGPNIQELQKQQEKIRQEADKMQQKELEFLKEQDPQLYKERKLAIDTQSKIEAILSSYSQGKISAIEAERQIYPYVKQSMQPYIDGLGTYIERLEKKLTILKKARSNPDILIKQRIDQMLGKAPINPEDTIDY